MTIGFVGLGQMGAPMAGHLVAQGVITYDSRPEAVVEGAKTATELAEVAEADLISIMVRDDAQVNDVCEVLLPLAHKGTIIAIHSTIQAGTAIELAARAVPYGVEVVDAPVSGGFMGAAAGNLAVMIGGSDAAFARCQEAFGAWADLILHMGPAGAGTKAKLARNLLHFVAFTAAAEAQQVAEAAGLSLRKLGRVVRHTDAITGGPGSIMIRASTGPMAEDDPLYGIFRHARALGEKDLSLVLELADELGVDVPFARLAYEKFGESLGVAE
jgi:3-hydroxyisobutyrate dehydrogenase-like beta-hydroxyacid dehydrogenase